MRLCNCLLGDTESHGQLPLPTDPRPMLEAVSGELREPKTRAGTRFVSLPPVAMLELKKSSSHSWHTGGYLDLHGAASLTSTAADAWSIATSPTWCLQSPCAASQCARGCRRVCRRRGSPSCSLSRSPPSWPCRDPIR